MKYSILLALVTSLVCGSAVMAAEEDGWVELFNGKNLDGWEKKGGEATYKAEDGAIIGTTVPNTGNTFLCTKELFQDFDLQFEFLANPSMNSGCQFRSESYKEYKDYRVHGYQCELENENRDRGWSGGIYDESRRGWLFPKKDDEEHGKKFGEAGKKIWKNGEWNKVRIRCEGDHIQTWINGELRTDFHDDLTEKGFIGLQVHSVGDRKEPLSVKWRNIRIKKL